MYRGTPILHDDTQKLKKDTCFCRSFFRCKVIDIKLGLVVFFVFCFFLDMSNLKTDTVIYIIESKLTKLTEI